MTAPLLVIDAATSAIAGLPETPALDLHLGRIAAAIVVGGLVALAVVLAMRRLGTAKLMRIGHTGNAKISVLEAKRLSVHADVCRMACDGREYVLVVGPAGATVISSRDQDAGSGP
jgi:hypothetical protein